jgi:hypothetical protein
MINHQEEQYLKRLLKENKHQSSILHFLKQKVNVVYKILIGEKSVFILNQGSFQKDSAYKPYGYLINKQGKKGITIVQYAKLVDCNNKYDIFIDGFTKEVWCRGKRHEKLTDSEYMMIKTYIETGKSLAPFQVIGYVKEYKKSEEEIAWSDKKLKEMLEHSDTIDEDKWEVLKNSSEFAEEMLQRIAESAYVIFKSARRKVDIKQGKEFVYFPQAQRRGRDRLAKYQFKPENLTYCLIIPS